MDFDREGAFPLSTLGAVVVAKDTTRGYIVLGRQVGLLGGMGLASAPNDEGT